MIDFERAELLMRIVVEAGKHGPMYQHISSKAGQELKEMIEADKVQERESVQDSAEPALLEESQSEVRRV